MKKHKTVMNKWTGGAMLAGMSLISLPAIAQDVENIDDGAPTPATVEQPAEKSIFLPIKVTTGLSEQFKSDIDSGGSFSLMRFKAAATVPVRLGDTFVLSTSMRYTFDNYTFDNIPDPWQNINTLSVASILAWRMDDTWTIYGGGFAKWSAESGATFSDGATGGGLVGFNYKVDDNLTLGAGLVAMSVLEDDAKVLPLILAKWKFADYWRLDVGLTDVSNLGYGAKLNWLYNEQFEFGLGAQFQNSRFRIERANGVGQDRSTAVYIDGTWHASPLFDLNAYVGIAAGGQLQVDTSTGKKVLETDYNPAPMLGVNATLKF